MTPTRQRHSYMDVLNVVAMWLVIFTHVRGQLDRPMNTVPFWAEMAVSGVSGAAVPLFLMISGANLMSFVERESIPRFLAKRFGKVLVPYLVFVQIDLAIYAATGQVDNYSFTTALTAVFAGSHYSITLWYLEALMGIYLVMPVLSLALRGIASLGMNRWRAYGYIVALSLVASLGIPIIRRFFPEFAPSFELPFGGLCLVFPIVGSALAHGELPRWLRWVIYGIGMCGYLSRSLGAGLLRLADSSYVWLVTDYLTPSTLAVGAAIFVAARYLGLDGIGDRPRRVFAWLAGLTFGIYLVHIGVLELVRYFVVDPSVAWEPVFIAVIWLVSAGIVAAARQIPVVRRWILP